MERYYIPKQHLYYLSLLLHGALLQEKYAQAAYTLVAISQNPQSLPEQIWRVSVLSCMWFCFNFNVPLRAWPLFRIPHHHIANIDYFAYLSLIFS